MTDLETKKLFDDDAYAKEFTALVLSVRKAETETGKPAKANDLEIILDQTLFFPEEGGQTPDKGTLGGFPVVDVQLVGGVIRHFVRISEEKKNTASELFAPGQTVTGRIDFAHRFSNMQNHSGEHILSGLVHGKFGYDNVGFHLSENTVTLDFNGPLSDEDILWLEKAANRIVWDNLEICACYPDEETLKKTPYRSKKEIDGPLRLVEIPGVDVCACCAPHVHRTGEIGLIKIIRTLRERSGIRLTIVCGSRALAYVQQIQKAAEDASHLTNLPREEIASGISRLLDENERLKRRESDLEAMVTKALEAAVPKEQENAFVFVDGIGNLAQRNLVNRLCASHTGYCAVFNGNDETGYKYIIGAGTLEKTAGSGAGVPESGAGIPESGEKKSGSGNEKDRGKKDRTAALSNDARVLNACLHKSCGARGGGKPAMVQGSVKAAEKTIRAALRKALYERAEDRT